MAQKVVVQLIDDLDGSEADDITTIQFGLDGVSYEIDLTDSNASRLRDDLADYIAAARRVRGRSKSAVRLGGGDSAEALRIRGWAKENGISLKPRGAIPKKIKDQYRREAANTGHRGTSTGRRSRSTGKR